MSVIFTGIRVASLADVDTVHSWIEKWQIEPGWTSVANRRNVVSSGNVIFSPTPSFSDGVKWNEHTKKGEKRGNRTLWVVSGFQNVEMRRYSTTLVHHGQKCSLVAYLFDGDNLPSASLISMPPSPFKGLLPSNEPSDTKCYQSTNKLPSSAMERIKNVVETLAVEMGVDVHILLSIISDVFGRGEPGPGQPLAECPLLTSSPGETQRALDNVLISPTYYAAAELPEYGNLPACRKRRVCDVPDKKRKKQKTRDSERAASGVRKIMVRASRYGGPTEWFAPQGTGIGDVGMSSRYQNALLWFGKSCLTLLEHRLTSCGKNVSANSAVAHGMPTSSPCCTHEQLQQLDSETYGPCDASEEHARNVAHEGDYMSWSTANARGGLINNHTPLSYFDHPELTSYPATSDKQYSGGTVSPTQSTSTNMFLYIYNDWQYSDGPVSPGAAISKRRFMSILPGQPNSTSANRSLNFNPLVYNTMSSCGAFETAQSQVYSNSTHEDLQQLDYAATPSSSWFGNPIQPSQLDEDANGHGKTSAGCPPYSQAPNHWPPIYASYPSASDQLEQFPHWQAGGPVSSSQSASANCSLHSITGTYSDMADPFQCTAANLFD